MTAAAHDTALHLLDFRCHSILTKRLTGKANEIKNIPILPGKGTGWLFVFRFYDLPLFSVGTTGRCPANGFLIRHHGNAQIAGMVDLVPHPLRPYGAVDVELLAGLQQPQGHLPDFGVPLRVLWVRDGREQ